MVLLFFTELESQLRIISTVIKVRLYYFGRGKINSNENQVRSVKVYVYTGSIYTVV